MKYLMFNQKFVESIRSGAKTQTIRAYRYQDKPPYIVGEPISLRTWKDKPYRSYQRTIKVSSIVDYSVCTITTNGLFTCGACFTNNQDRLREFAQRDGFSTWNELICWIAETYHLPFQAQVIQWK